MKKAVMVLLVLCLTLAASACNAQTTARSELDLNLKENEAVIYVAGGCFWGMEKLMSVIPGVTDAVSGYANGSKENPTYQEVCAGDTGHRETVRVVYRPAEVSLQAILSVYFQAIDPTVQGRQGNDTGDQYQTGIYYTNPQDELIVRAAAANEEERYPQFYVEIGPLTAFYEAEPEHQDYLDMHPGGYCHIAPGLFQKAAEMIVDPASYEKPNEATLKETLTPEQYAVTREAATEKPYANEYWQTTEDGLYVDITTGEPLFSSADKYLSSCGWPAFGKGLDDNALFYARDDTHGMLRIEVRSRVGNAHLGHVFEGDSESPTGIRYCINSAALRFIPYEEMDEAGYGEYKAYVRPVTAQYHQLTPEQAKERMEQNPKAVILDVREQAEYDSGHIPGAVLLPLSQIDTDPPALLPEPDGEILVYCRSGRRSREAAERLVAMGYTAVYDFGGIQSWPYEITVD